MSDRSTLAIEAMLAGIQVPENTDVFRLELRGSFLEFWDREIRPYGHKITRENTRQVCHVYVVSVHHKASNETSYKVGISDNPLRRSKSYVSTTPPGFAVELCRHVVLPSRELAETLERSILLAAARAGFWSHGEWVSSQPVEDFYGR